MSKVRINSDVIATIARRVATPEFAGAEWAFELSFEPRGENYYVEKILGEEAGTTSSAPTPRAFASAHTHYIENYREQQCHVGWPSGEDMRWIFRLAVEKGALVVHLCSAVEGTYIVACYLHGASPEARQADANGEDIFRYFSSSHGHRCAPGHNDEDYPSAEAFIQLAHAFRFTGPICERHAGEGATCTRASKHRESFAKAIGKKQIFFAKFAPHKLTPVKSAKTYYGTSMYYGSGARAHLENIKQYNYDHPGAISFKKTSRYVDLDVPSARARPIV
jgi:hypothetical protein